VAGRLDVNFFERRVLDSHGHMTESLDQALLSRVYASPYDILSSLRPLSTSKQVPIVGVVVIVLYCMGYR
jgi:hypothetical protein